MSSEPSTSESADSRGPGPAESESTAGSSTAGGAASKRRRRWPWLLLLSLLLVVVGLRVALPTLIERGAAYGSRYWLGLPARIDNADFTLLDGVVVLEGVRVGALPDGIEPMDAAFEPPSIDAEAALFSLDRISLALSWSDLRQGRVRIGDVTLESPAVRVLREKDGAIDPLRHARPLAPPPQEEDETEDEGEESAPWPIEVDLFLLNAPNVVVVDSNSGENLVDLSLETFELAEIALDGDAFSLGGVALEGPVLRVRRDLVFADTPAEESPVEEPAMEEAAVEEAAVEEAAVEEAAVEEAAVDEAAVDEAAVEETDAGEADPESAEGDGSSAPGFRVEEIHIERATFTWVTDKGPLDVALALRASDISADEGKQFPVDLKLEVAEGSLALEGQVGILPPSYVGKLTWKGLPFPPLLLASVPDLSEWLRSADSAGELSVDADIGGVRGSPSLRFSGRARVETLEIADPGDEEVSLGWKQLDVVLDEARVPLPEPGSPPAATVARFGRIALTAPKIRYTNPSPKLFALLGLGPVPENSGEGKDDEAKAAADEESADPESSMVVVAAKPDSPADGESASPVDLTIASLELTGGDLEVLDTTVEPPVTSTIKQLGLWASDVRFPDPAARTVKLRAVLPKSSALKVDGQLRPGTNGEFTLTLQKLDLPVFDPYAAGAGAKLESGQASLKTELKLRGAKISADNDLVLRKFGVSLGDSSWFEDTFGVPLDLALALLRDPTGNISLSIPVEVDEKGSQVSLTTILASTLRAALVGALSAPLKLVGTAFTAFQADEEDGGTGLGIPPLASLPGGDEPEAAAASQIDGLAKLLQERPAMGLLLRGRTGAADSVPVAEQLLAEAIADGDGLPDLDDAGFLARRRVRGALEAKASAAEAGSEAAEPLSAEDQALYDRYVASVAIPSERLDALARRRAEAAQEQLLAAGVEADQLEVGERDEDGSPGVVVSLKVH